MIVFVHYSLGSNSIGCERKCVQALEKYLELRGVYLKELE